MSADVLAQWQAREEALRPQMQEFGLSRPDQLAGKTGLELFRAMMAGELPGAPIAKTLGFNLVEVEPGRVVFQGRPAQAYYNPLGTVHGGWYATLLDSAVACAVHSILPAGRAYTTLELKLNMVKALTDKVPLVRTEGKIIHPGRQVATAEGRLYGPDGTLYAHATTTCLIFDLPGAKA
jgi:uncharacterized protein (TIGR00369 family)